MPNLKDITNAQIKKYGTQLAVAEKFGFDCSHISRLSRGLAGSQNVEKYVAMIIDAYPSLSEVLSKDPATIESIEIKYVGHDKEKSPRRATSLGEQGESSQTTTSLPFNQANNQTM